MKKMSFKEIRNSFWDLHPEFKDEYRYRKKQNDYSTDVRVSFCDYIENLRRDGIITESQANRITL